MEGRLTAGRCIGRCLRRENYVYKTQESYKHTSVFGGSHSELFMVLFITSFMLGKSYRETDSKLHSQLYMH